MEADRSFQHFCKLCNKSFRCGRSLGGHMRSHLTNPESEFNEKVNREKLRGLNNGGSNSDKMKIMDSSTCSGYGLRENPKRNSKQRNLDSDNSIRGKFCRECGREFQSWKALFGHMKCHSEKEKTSIKMEDQESWSFVDQKPVNDSHSDNEFSAPNRKKRSSRRRIRRTKTSTSSSFSIANASSSASEIDQEQEQIALCLIMLSRDMGHWGGICSIAESSDNISTFSEIPSEFGEMDSGNGYFLRRQTEFQKTKLKNKSEQDDRFERIINSATKLGKNIIDEAPKIGSKRQRTSKIHHPDNENYEISQKRSRFECSSCRKVFRSYQALGGHKASHRKTKSFFDSTMEVAENSNEAENENQIDPEISVSTITRKIHECPICFKLFSSGQALGGHKRSHLFGCSENSNDQSISLRRKIPEIRDLIDLNLPAPADEESNNLVVHPRWVESFYENEKLLSLIYNGASL